MIAQIFVLSLRTSFFHAAHPEIMENLKSKDDLLINRMSQLKIEQTGKPINPVSRNSFIMQTCPCNILQYFTAIKMIIFR